MSDEFQKTVNLKDRMNVKGRISMPGGAENAGAPSKIRQIEQVYNNNDKEGHNDLQKIDKPHLFKLNERAARTMMILAVCLCLGALIYWLFPAKPSGSEKNTPQIQKNTSWYMIKLANGEIYYGQSSDIKSDPVVIRNVYYDYDQGKGKETNDAGSLRLVKKGKESYGPSGTMNVVRSQILFFDELSPESKVLKAILEYEGK